MKPVTYYVDGRAVGFFQRVVANKTFAVIAAAALTAVAGGLTGTMTWPQVGSAVLIAIAGAMYKGQAVSSELAALAANDKVPNVIAVTNGPPPKPEPVHHPHTYQ